MPSSTDQVPVETMTITEQEICLRKSQFSISAGDESALRGLQRLVDPELHMVVEEFYRSLPRDADGGGTIGRCPGRGGSVFTRCVAARSK